VDAKKIAHCEKRESGRGGGTFADGGGRSTIVPTCAVLEKRDAAVIAVWGRGEKKGPLGRKDGA